MSGRTASLSAGVSPDAERWIFWYLALTPLWWFLGLLVPVGAAGIVLLYALRPRTDPTVTAVCWLWFSATAAQSVSAVVNWASSAEPTGELVRSLASFSSTGWVLLGMCFGVGCSYRLSAPRLARSVSFQALWILILSAVGYAAFAVGGDSRLEMPSLLAVAIPSLADPGTINFSMRFFLKEDFMGDSVFRLVLFFPWSTGLALAGFLTLLLAFHERGFKWRVVAMAGGLTGFVLSYSRAVFAASVVGVAAIVMLRSRNRTRLWLIIGAALLAELALVLGFGPETGISDVYRAFTQARAGSSEARNELYRAAWRGFLQSPWIGHGWFGQTYARWMPINIGSHSTFYGALYVGGVLTFAVVCTAYAGTLWLCLSRLRTGGEAIVEALALLLVYGITSYGETIQTLVPSLLVSFVWIGGEMAVGKPGSRDSEIRSQARTMASLAYRRRWCGAPPLLPGAGAECDSNLLPGSSS